MGAAVTAAGEAYKGTAAGRVRFALARLAAGTPFDRLRMHAKDGAGGLVAVLTSLDGICCSSAVACRADVQGPVSWTLNDERTSSLEPSVLDLAREKVSRCIELTLTGERPLLGPSGQSIC